MNDTQHWSKRELLMLGITAFHPTYRADKLILMINRNNMKICTYSESMTVEIADLFHSAVHHINPSIYTKEQQEAWAPTPPNYDNWSIRLGAKNPFVAIIDGNVAGFIELEKNGHIDCFYTHPKFQQKGVGTSLYNYLLVEARRNKIRRLYVEASHTAKDFFTKQGFILIKENEVLRNSVCLINYTMEKFLDE